MKKTKYNCINSFRQILKIMLLLILGAITVTACDKSDSNFHIKSTVNSNGVVCDSIPSDLSGWSKSAMENFYISCEQQYKSAPNIPENKYLYLRAMSETNSVEKYVKKLVDSDYNGLEDLYAPEKIAIFKEVEKEAETGKADAQVVMAYLYKNGHFVFEDDDIAREILEHLVDDEEIVKKHPEILCVLGFMYVDRFNKGKKNEKKARELFNRGVNDFNQKQCMLHLGLAHYNGKLGYKKNAKEAENLFLPIATEGKNILSIWGIFGFYANRQSEIHNIEKAQYWFCQLQKYKDDVVYKLSSEAYPNFVNNCK